ncbi:MAG: WcaF family extracellular polysaccharide biosynthesis acetyltransferase [Cyclobacteriaceae bacterium]
MSRTTDLSSFDNSEYQPGGYIKRGLWYLVNALVFDSAILPISSFKTLLLRVFGATVGHGVVIKPKVNIKYPWFLHIGNHVWLGEGVWIDNLGEVVIGNHCCISQGAMLLTGNHNFKSSSFDLMVSPIQVKDGVWIGAQSVVCPGVHCESHSVLAVGSVATGHLEPYTIYQGNPAKAIRERVIQ